MGRSGIGHRTDGSGGPELRLNDSGEAGMIMLSGGSGIVWLDWLYRGTNRLSFLLQRNRVSSQGLYVQYDTLMQ